jgi:hypothetical protein
MQPSTQVIDDRRAWHRLIVPPTMKWSFVARDNEESGTGGKKSLCDMIDPLSRNDSEIREEAHDGDLSETLHSGEIRELPVHQCRRAKIQHRCSLSFHDKSPLGGTIHLYVPRFVLGRSVRARSCGCRRYQPQFTQRTSISTPELTRIVSIASHPPHFWQDSAMGFILSFVDVQFSKTKPKASFDTLGSGLNDLWPRPDIVDYTITSRSPRRPSAN